MTGQRGSKRRAQKALPVIGALLAGVKERRLRIFLGVLYRCPRQTHGPKVISSALLPFEEARREKERRAGSECPEARRHSSIHLWERGDPGGRARLNEPPKPRNKQADK